MKIWFHKIRRSRNFSLTRNASSLFGSLVLLLQTDEFGSSLCPSFLSITLFSTVEMLRYCLFSYFLNVIQKVIFEVHILSSVSSSQTHNAHKTAGTAILKSMMDFVKCSKSSSEKRIKTKIFPKTAYEFLNFSGMLSSLLKMHFFLVEMHFLSLSLKCK